MTPVASQVAVYRRATGALEHLAPATLAPAASDPTFASVALPAGFDDSTFIWNATAKAMVEDLAKVKAITIARIKADKAAMLAAAYTSVFGKQKIYARKQEEVNAFRALAPLVTNLTTIVNTVAYTSLGVANQKDKFRFALAEAALRGVSVGTVINEYATRIDSVEPQSAAWEAIEQVACAAVRAATSGAQVRAAYAAIDWKWTAP